MIKIKLEYGVLNLARDVRINVSFPTIIIGGKKYFFDHNSKLQGTDYETCVISCIFLRDDLHNKYRIKEFVNSLRNVLGNLGESIEITNKEKIINDLCSALGVELKEDFATGGLVTEW